MKAMAMQDNPGYIRRVVTNARTIISEAVSGIGWLDVFLLAVALAAITAAAFEPVAFAQFSAGELLEKRWFGMWRGINIALGLFALVNVRAISTLQKLAVAGVVVGLAMNIARNAMPTGAPLTLSFAILNGGISLWFVNLVIRPSMLERLEQANVSLKELTAQLSDREGRLIEQERHITGIESRLTMAESRCKELEGRTSKDPPPA